jgi:hypothetical protein
MRRLEIILISMGLAVITSCSKDRIDDEIARLDPATIQNTSDNLALEGTFWGEWRLSKYGMTCEGQIEVTKDEIAFDVPADYLFPRLGIVTEERKAKYPEEPLFTSDSAPSYSNTRQVMVCSLQGYSEAATYSQLSNRQGIEITTVGDLLFDVKIEDVEYHIVLKGIKEKPTAVFDFNTGLWTVAIPIDTVTITNKKTGTSITSTFIDEEAPDKSAWLFVFRAAKRIK